MLASLVRKSHHTSVSSTKQELIIQAEQNPPGVWLTVSYWASVNMLHNALIFNVNRTLKENKNKNTVLAVLQYRCVVVSATLICDVLPEFSTRKVTWYFKSCRHYNTGSTVRPYLYDTWLALLVKCIFLNKKKGKKDIFIPFIRPPCNIYSSPPKETLPQSSTHSISFKYWGSEYWHFVDNYSNSSETVFLSVRLRCACLTC